MPSIDVDAVLIAIRVATYGEKMDVGANCPSCSHANDYQLNLVSYIEGVAHFHYDDVIQIGPLTFHIKPYTYQEATKTALKSLEQQKIFQIVNDDDLSDEIKLEKFGQSFIKLTELTIDTVADSIDKIECSAGIVTDTAFIKEFLANTDKKVFSLVQDAVSKSRDAGKIDALSTECPHCKHQYQVNLSFDQADFFGAAS
jgi:Zn ribbon nucleic-acid-binding protein